MWKATLTSKYMTDDGQLQVNVVYANGVTSWGASYRGTADSIKKTVESKVQELNAVAAEAAKVVLGEVGEPKVEPVPEVVPTEKEAYLAKLSQLMMVKARFVDTGVITTAQAQYAVAKKWLVDNFKPEYMV